MPDTLDWDTDDDEALGPEARMFRDASKPARDSIVKEQKVPLDADHECPWCLGKGYVHITQEPAPLKRNRLMKGNSNVSG